MKKNYVIILFTTHLHITDDPAYEIGQEHYPAKVAAPQQAPRLPHEAML